VRTFRIEHGLSKFVGMSGVGGDDEDVGIALSDQFTIDECSV
jgi:hypothetical protein